MSTDPNHRLDVFDPGDKTALICIDVPEMERIVVQQLREMEYKVHTGFSLEDLLFKMRAHSYDVLVVAEHFGAMNLDTNELLAEATNAPAAQRHRQLVVLTGASLRTGDELQAFQHSVDVVVNLGDVINLRPVLRRAVQRAQEFYGRYFEVLAAADAA